MNERIRQLLSQAGVHYEVLPKDTVYEKFAELIVRECALICESRPGPGDDIRSRQHCSEQILEHFGVE